MRTSSLARARRDVERVRDRILDRRTGRARRRRPGRLPAVGAGRPAGAGGRRARRADVRLAGRDCRPAAGAAAASALPATRTSPPMPRSSPRSRSTRWCGCGGCGARPMPGSSSIRMAPSTSSKAASSKAASWALKEGVRLDGNGISSRDWETYPVLRFSEVPEIAVELIDPAADRPPLGVGEAIGRPDRRRDRQRRGARARHPAARPAADPRADHGGPVAGIAGAI